MALEIRDVTLPTFFELVYDNISELTNDEHKKAFIDVARGFLENILLITNKDIKILLPKQHYKQLSTDTWILLSELLLEAEDFLIFLYNSGEFEFNTALQIQDSYYKMMINSDPVVLMLKKAK